VKLSIVDAQLNEMIVSMNYYKDNEEK